MLILTGSTDYKEEGKKTDFIDQQQKENEPSEKISEGSKQGF